MLRVFKNVKRAIAEWLFESELDEDYQLGIFEGSRATKLTIRLQLVMLRDQAPKSKQAGIQAALDQIGDVA